MSGVFVRDPPSSLLPLGLNHAAWTSSGQHPCVDPSALIARDTNFRNHAVYRFSAQAVHVLCLPCESLSLDWDQPHKNIPIIIVSQQSFHIARSWETSSFGNVYHQLCVIKPIFSPKPSCRAPGPCSPSERRAIQIEKHQWCRNVKRLQTVVRPDTKTFPIASHSHSC